jgi:hypothetical protein
MKYQSTNNCKNKRRKEKEKKKKKNIRQDDDVWNYHNEIPLSKRK